MKTNELLSRLDKVKKTGNNRWVACCPAHNGDGRSLTITEANDKILLKCWAYGCGAGEIMEAIGMDIGDLFDRQLPKQEKQRLNFKGFNANDILEILGDEIIVAELIAEKLLINTANYNDIQRLKKCRERFITASAYAQYGVKNEDSTEFVTTVKSLVKAEHAR